MSYQREKLDVIKIKNNIDPYYFYLEQQNLSHYGSHAGSWMVAGLCPFHDDKTPGSFKINSKTGAFKCWSCGANGSDIIAFLQQRDALSFMDALSLLSREWRVF